MSGREALFSREPDRRSRDRRQTDRRVSGRGDRRDPSRQTLARANDRRTNDRRRGDRRRPPSPAPDPRNRLLALLAVIVIAGGTFVALLVDLQAVRPDRYLEVGQDQRTREVELSGYRGAIIDRSGFVLATSTTGHSLVVDPQMIEDPQRSAEVLAPVLGLDVETVRQSLLPEQEGDRDNLVVKSMTPEATDALEVAREADEDDLLAGVFLRRQEERVYPASTLARPVVGGVDPDEQGVYGIEEQFNEMMQGSAGYELSERGVFGSISGGEYLLQPAVQGDDIVLTIDHRIQFVAEEALIQHCEETLANNATAVVSDPRSGEVLAMATVIRFEDGTCGVPTYNAPLVDTFEPGSVLKIVTAAAAVEELGYTDATQVNVPTEVVIDGKSFKEGHGEEFVAAPYPLSQIIERSMNVGIIKVATELGAETLAEYLDLFGFGQMTGLDFKGESRGNVRDVSDWYGTDLGSIPIGQGVTVNAVQLNSAYNVIANGGIYIQPRLVRSIVDESGNEQPLEPQSSRIVVSQETASIVSDMLVDVVHSPKGTGTQAAVAGYTVAGKTGTAWKVFDEGQYAGTFGEEGARKYVVTFAGFLPAEDPQLSITVVVDEPITETTAGKVAAPVFADIAQYAARILAIPPASAGVDPDAGLVQGTPAGAPDLVAAQADEAALQPATLNESATLNDTATLSETAEPGATGDE